MNSSWILTRKTGGFQERDEGHQWLYYYYYDYLVLSGIISHDVRYSLNYKYKRSLFFVCLPTRSGDSKQYFKKNSICKFVLG